MILDDIKQIITKEREKNSSDLYIKTAIKEYLQIYVLNFIYTHSVYSKNFIFTGGTCLRRCFGLNRLSEDLDFDLIKPVDAEKLKGDLTEYFYKKYLYKDVYIKTGQKGRQVLLKFPILRTLGLATKSESDLLYVKVDLSLVESKSYKTLTTLKSTYNFNYIITHYDLPTLMASKIATVLTRSRFIGKENIKIIKGRDYFDLLWFLENKVYPDLKRINDSLEKKYSLTEVIGLVDEKVNLAVVKQKNYFKQDLLPFIDNQEVVDPHINSYVENYNLYKRYLLS